MVVGGFGATSPGTSLVPPRAAQGRTGGQVLPVPRIRTPEQAAQQEGHHGAGLHRSRGTVMVLWWIDMFLLFMWLLLWLLLLLLLLLMMILTLFLLYFVRVLAAVVSDFVLICLICLICLLFCCCQGGGPGGRDEERRRPPPRKR